LEGVFLPVNLHEVVGWIAYFFVLILFLSIVNVDSVSKGRLALGQASTQGKQHTHCLINSRMRYDQRTENMHDLNTTVYIQAVVRIPKHIIGKDIPL